MSLTQEEYLRLCQTLADQYYDYDNDLSDIPEDSWIPGESEVKEKLKNLSNNGFMDLTNAKSNQVIDSIHKVNNFKVGNFLVKVSKFSGMPGYGLKVDLLIYEEKLIRNKFFKDTKISVKINVHKDMRFNSRDWINYFNSEKKGIGIPVDTVPDIIRWIQAVQKMKAFL